MFSYMFQSQTGTGRVGILSLAFGIRLPARGRDASALLNGSSSLRRDRVRCTDDCAKGIKSFK